MPSGAVKVDVKDIEELAATLVALEDIMRLLRRDVEKHIVIEKRPAARSRALLRVIEDA